MIKSLSRHYRSMREHLWTRPRLSPYLDGEVSEAERRRVEEHAHVCPQCHRILETLKRTLVELRGMADERSAPSGLADSVMARIRAEC